MSITRLEAIEFLSRLTPTEEAAFLARLGHWLTVVARGAYEFQAPGVVDPILLRRINEIQHRVFAQIAGLVENGERAFDSEDLVSWLSAEDREPELQLQCLDAFARVQARHNNRTA